MWSDLQRVIHLRSLEETDREPPDWTPDRAREATLSTRQQFPHASTDRFLLERSKHYQPDSSSAPPIPSLPTFPGWLTLLLLVAAFVIGWAMSAVGQEREINLLALPLLALLAWNGMVCTLSLFKTPLPSFGGAFIDRCIRQHGAGDTNPQQHRFFELARPSWLIYLAGQFRTMLHLAAAILALGSITSMYARGWSKEYRAVWESTILDDSGATTFFSTIFHPASLILGAPVPKDQIPTMRRGADQPASKPAPALPWIHLYATTLGLFVILPRLCLLLVEARRSRRLASDTLRSRDWKNYASQLLALTDGVGATVHVLIHALPVESSQKDQWRILARQHWRDARNTHFTAIPAGEETQFIHDWSPPKEPFLMLVFNIASAPEIEVHRWLVEAILDKWSQIRPHPTLAILLDEFSLHKRWSGLADYQERLAKRRETWHQTLRDLPVQILPPANT